MPFLKCVGGEKDGHYFDVGGLRVGDTYKIKLKSLTAVSANAALIPESVEGRVVTYTVRQFIFPGKEAFRFLAPAEWSDKEAVEFQFRK